MSPTPAATGRIRRSAPASTRTRARYPLVLGLEISGTRFEARTGRQRREGRRPRRGLPRARGRLRREGGRPRQYPDAAARHDPLRRRRRAPDPAADRLSHAPHHLRHRAGGDGSDQRHRRRGRAVHHAACGQGRRARDRHRGHCPARRSGRWNMAPSASWSRQTRISKQAVLAFTGGRGVDLAINSLGATMLDRTFNVVRKLGHIISIGEAEVSRFKNIRERILPRSQTFTRLHLGHVDPDSSRPGRTAWPTSYARRARRLVEGADRRRFRDG